MTWARVNVLLRDHAVYYTEIMPVLEAQELAQKVGIHATHSTFVDLTALYPAWHHVYNEEYSQIFVQAIHIISIDVLYAEEEEEEEEKI